jgi:hypothetical protein
MMNIRKALSVIAALSFGSASLAIFGQTSSATVPSPAKAAPSTQAMIHYGQLPLSFEANRGQTSSNVQWLARGPEYTLFLTGNDAVLQMNRIVAGKRGAANPEELKPSISSSVVRMSLLGAGTSLQTTGEDLQSGKANYFTGNDPAKWQRDVPMYGKVQMQGVYPGVALAYYGHRGELEYDFVVAPGADASAINLRFDGAKPALAANGDLVLPVEGGPEVRFNKPVVYQMKDGARQPVEGSFVIADNKAGVQISFHLGAYDHSRELVIDPKLLFVGTLGTGNYETQANGMAVDAAGEIFLTGVTADLAFPTTSGALQPTCPAMSPVSAQNGYARCGGGYLSSGFVTKISADGTSLLYSTYLHGLSGGESGQSIAADAAGDAYVLGATSSNDFPVTPNAYEAYCLPHYEMNGCCSLASPLTAVSGCDAYNSSGEYGVGGPSLFISKLNPSGSALLYSTFFDGSNASYPVGIALDSSNNIYFSGYESSAQSANNVYPFNATIQFPVTANAYQQVGVGMPAATLSELSANGQTLLYSTFLGTLGTTSYFASTQPLAMTIGPNGMAYVGGITYASGFPTTPGSVKPACVVSSGNSENCQGFTGFVSAFDTTKAGAASLAYSTFIGGDETPGSNIPMNQVNALAADSSNNLYVAGNTYAYDYPTTPGVYQPACGHTNSANECSTAFVSKIDPTGSAYVWSTFYGGTSANPPNESASGVQVDAAGRVYLYGLSNGGDLPQVNPVEPWYGNNEIFIATLSADATQLLFGTYFGNPTFGGAQPIPSNGIVLDAAGNIYFAGSDNPGSGWTSSTPGTYSDPITGGWNITFFGKISPVFAPSATTLIIAPTTAATGQIVTFTATVAGTTQSTPAPTGTVTLTNTSTNPATTLGTITLANGTGQFTTSSLTAGSYSVIATYSGDGDYETSTSTAQSLTINTSAVATVTLGSLARIYAGVPLAATATTSSPSGLTVTFTYTGTSGTTYGPSSTPPKAVGNYTVVGTISSSTYSGSATGTLVIARALLTATTNNGTMVVGSAVPALTASYNGFVPGDSAAVLSGSPVLSTTATSSSPAALYPITIAQGTLSAANYAFAFINGTMLVSPAATASIAISAKLTGSAGAGYKATVTATNSGAGAAANAELTTASLGSATGSPLPISFGTIAAGGGTSTVVVNIPGSAGSDGAAVVQRLAGSYTGGSFSASSKVTLP